MLFLQKPFHSVGGPPPHGTAQPVPGAAMRTRVSFRCHISARVPSIMDIQPRACPEVGVNVCVCVYVRARSQGVGSFRCCSEAVFSSTCHGGNSCANGPGGHRLPGAEFK